MSTFAQTISLLMVSNLFMMTAWYLHLRSLSHKAWYVAAILSWGIAFFEYLVHIPANRIGYTVMSLPQLQIVQIGMSLLLFVPFSIVVMNNPVKQDYIWAAVCLVGAGYFIFRGES